VINLFSHAPDKRKRPQYTPEDFAEIRSNCVATNIGKANRIVGRIYEEAFRDMGISSPQFALLVVLAIKRNATASELAEELGADPSTVSRNTELMVKRGLICVSTGADRRVRTYCLTDDGNETIQSAVPQWKKAQRTALRRIGRGSWRDVRKALRRIVTD
jgi:DNA-binding MarR family transcriptional regulator